MEVIETIAQMRQVRSTLTEPVGFVPTMGYLHEGHLSLVRQARVENSSVAVSIFVNPAQFGPGEDFSVYPRDTQRDLAMLEKEKTDIVFMPEAAEMYPENFTSWIEVGKVSEPLEGAARPGHFRGVSTVVAKLFNIVQPDKAYFGQKDAQQAVVIKKMVADLDMNLEVIILPTVRETDGLAMSSRNTYLSPEQRQAAPILHHTLSVVHRLYFQGERNAGYLRQQMTAIIEQEPLAEIDYVSIANNKTLEELTMVTPPALISLAVKFGKTRLIDNIVVE
ncbi:pantoate--beta-alanine ligase [Chloroflexota bacterium]